MTTFDKDLFHWDGMYLMYTGEHNKSFYYIGPNCHPSRERTAAATFIARFKYGSKPWKSWRNFIVKNFTVEEWVDLAEATSPLEAIESKGFKLPQRRRRAA